MEHYLKKYHKLFFFALAVFLLYPVFQGGYIFLLDWKVTPNIFWSDINLGVDSLTNIIAKIFSIVFSFALWQKIFLLGIVYFLGLAGFRLAKRTGNIYAQYFSGLFFIFNPFIYARLVEQTGIAAGCAALFWFLIYLLEYLEDKNMGKIIQASICAGLAIAFFLHSIFFIALSLAVILFCDYFKRQEAEFFFKSFLTVILVIFVINGNWMLAAFLKADNFRGSAAESFTAKDVETFATRSIGGDSIYTTVLALQGYWGEYQDRFVSVQDNPWWKLFFGIIFLVSLFGLIHPHTKRNILDSNKKEHAQTADADFGVGVNLEKDYLGKGMAVIFVVAYILAIGIASPIIKPLALFLYENVPFYIGLREPQKWVALLVFVYAYLGGWGVAGILQWEKIKKYRREAGIFLALLPLFFAFPIIQGMRSHLTPHQFPEEWKEAKVFLEKKLVAGQILFFPWHSYLKLDFAQKNITVPARSYFGKNVIQGNNTEFGKVYSHSLDKQTLAIEKYVAQKDSDIPKINYANFSSDMKKLGIQTVMLAKAEDWSGYAWLDRIGAEKILENDKLIIYRLP